MASLIFVNMCVLYAATKDYESHGLLNKHLIEAFEYKEIY